MRFSWKRFAALSGALSLLALLAACPAPVSADGLDGLEGGLIARVEEDWSLLVLQPDGVRASPQVSTQMARNPHGTRFCNFHINATDIPTYEEGGLQLQSWQGSTNVAYLTRDNRTVMATSGELVTWTQYLRAANGSLKFGISQSSSQTWGDFSGMEIDYGGTNTNLAIYSPDYSRQNSGVTYGANRVTSLVLVAVRTYDANGNLLWQDNTPYVVFSQALDNQLNQPGN
jgi:hypothetical protein